jgi:hypothetical protein
MRKRMSFRDAKVESRFKQRPVLSSILAGLVVLGGNALATALPAGGRRGRRSNRGRPVPLHD